MIKLAVRSVNIGAVIHLGGDPEVTTYIVAIEHPQLEKLLLDAPYTTKSISIVEANERKGEK